MSIGHFILGATKQFADTVSDERTQTRAREDKELERRQAYLSDLYKSMIENGTGDPANYAQALKDILTLSQAQSSDRPKAKGKAGFLGGSDPASMMAPFLDKILNGEIPFSGPSGQPQAGATLPPVSQPPSLTPPPDSLRVGGTPPPSKPFNGLDFSSAFGGAKTPFQVTAPQAGTAALNAVSAPLPPINSNYLIKSKSQQGLEASNAQVQAAIAKAKTNSAYLTSPDFKNQPPQLQAAITRELTGFTPPPAVHLQQGKVVPYEGSPTGYALQHIDPVSGVVTGYTDAPAPSLTGASKNNAEFAKGLKAQDQAAGRPIKTDEEYLVEAQRQYTTRIQQGADLVIQNIQNAKDRDEALKAKGTGMSEVQAYRLANSILSRNQNSTPEQLDALAQAFMAGSPRTLTPPPGVNVPQQSTTPTAPSKGAMQSAGITQPLVTKPFSARGKAVETSLNTIDALAPKVLDALEKSGLKDNNNPIDTKISAAIYKFGVHDNDLSDILQNIGLIHGYGLSGLLGGARNQKIMDILSQHLPQLGATYAQVYHQLKNLQGNTPLLRRAVAEAEGMNTGSTIPPGAPKEGDTKKNSHGDTVTFRNGAWVIGG